MNATTELPVPRTYIWRKVRQLYIKDAGYRCCRCGLIYRPKNLRIVRRIVKHGERIEVLCRWCRKGGNGSPFWMRRNMYRGDVGRGDHFEKTGPRRSIADVLQDLQDTQHGSD